MVATQTHRHSLPEYLHVCCCHVRTKTLLTKTSQKKNLYRRFIADTDKKQQQKSAAPFTAKKPLAFCQYKGSVCCNSQEDLNLQRQFKAANVSGSCSLLLKSLLCSKCDPFAAELYRIESGPRQVPVLCNSTVSSKSTQSLANIDFCSKFWDECRNLSLSNTPFAFQANSTSTISDTWNSSDAFCKAFGGASDESAVCFEGEAVSFNISRVTGSSPSGICLEKLGNGSYLNMVPHPDGSNRVFLSDQPGKIYLATIPAEGSGELLAIDEANPFLDLTGEVHFDAELGLLGIAFHPNYSNNGRFFVSFNCDKVMWPRCSGKCSCNSDMGCDPSKLPSDNGANPCQYHSVISEFVANGKNVKPVEVRRIFTMGLPFTSHHGGQILFGPKDGYLYFMMGDGGNRGDPYNFSQNKKSLLGKIMRLDVDTFPDAKTISEFQLWGNYSIPKDNPFSEDKELLPEIWAMGLRNPWRCSFDSERPSYFLCADVGEDKYEEVNIISKGGNYGWHYYEGPFPFNPPNSSEIGNSSSSQISNPIFPVMWYNHLDVNREEGSASITGGYFYRSTSDPCLYGRYLFADLFASVIWSGSETPTGSGNFTSSRIPFHCAADSPIRCSTGPEPSSASPALGFVFSFGQDNNKDMYVLASTGLYRIVRPSRCNFQCPLENVTASPPRPRPDLTAPSSSSPGFHRLNIVPVFVLFSWSFLVLLL
ncbi:PREDICTED: LOW QUALITY PROTEIN: HIPL1 protein [Tarenaya hassleriana]|uniref:LOW QUALITY PROTEIN: HIPL1 protein n=1 Tax=Tarenaya hassleriana TaxID=28532 RepID=UPI0008FD38A4|nr:PREDICTED: LOW QUALITY PROTEIN: HIPL1 protein [Tarenaya hassleriana]